MNETLSNPILWTAVSCLTAFCAVSGYQTWRNNKNDRQIRQILRDGTTDGSILQFDNHDQLRANMFDNVIYIVGAKEIWPGIFIPGMPYRPNIRQLEREIDKKSGVAVVNYNLGDFLTTNENERLYYTHNIITPSRLKQIIERGRNK